MDEHPPAVRRRPNPQSAQRESASTAPAMMDRQERWESPAKRMLRVLLSEREDFRSIHLPGDVSIVADDEHDQRQCVSTP